MGFDMTFHPVALSELQHFVFDPIDDPALIDRRLREVTMSSSLREGLRSMFDRVMAAVNGDVDEDDDDRPGPADEEVRFFAASIAGCLHPFWYARNAGLSLLRDVDTSDIVFQSYAQIGRGRITTIPDFPAPIITGNNSATGFMPPERVKLLLQRLVSDPLLQSELGEQATESLTKALKYASEHRLGLIEATDVYTAIGGTTDLGNLRDFPRSTAPISTPSSEPLKCPHCGLFNPPGSEHCDCGWNLAAPSAEAENTRRAATFGMLLIVAGVIYGVGSLYFESFRTGTAIACLALIGSGLYRVLSER
jgi:hypothetical protein